MIQQATNSWPRVFARIGMLLVFATLAGCTNRLLPPEQLQQPVTVHLVDHGRHPSLVLPANDRGWVRYVHGEWRWYAENETGLWRGLTTLFWPTDAAIGRRYLASAPKAGHRMAGIPEGFRHVYSLKVEKERVSALKSRLNRYFAEPEKIRFQPRYNLYFVPYPQDYRVFKHSNPVMARWLRELGVAVSGPALFSKWRLPSGTEAP